MTDFSLVHADAEREAISSQMNAMIFGAYRRVAPRPIGGVAFLSGVPPENARMNDALANVERAEREGADETTLAILNDQLDQAISAVREARQTDERARDPETGRFVPAGSFDGGVRREPGARRALPGLRQEAANDLFRRMVDASRAESEARGHEHTIVARNI